MEEGNDKNKVKKKVTCMYEKCHMKPITLYTNLKHLKIQLVLTNKRLLQKSSNCLKGYIMK